MSVNMSILLISVYKQSVIAANIIIVKIYINHHILSLTPKIVYPLWQYYLV